MHRHYASQIIVALKILYTRIEGGLALGENSRGDLANEDSSATPGERLIADNMLY